MEFEDEASRPQSAVPMSRQPVIGSRRRKGPAFLPSEHDELPPGVAFMVGHLRQPCSTISDVALRLSTKSLLSSPSTSLSRTARSLAPPRTR
jgi:hypothetical protein